MTVADRTRIVDRINELKEARVQVEEQYRARIAQIEIEESSF